MSGRLVAALRPVPLAVGVCVLIGYSAIAATRDNKQAAIFHYVDVVVWATVLVALGMLVSLPAITRAISRRGARRATAPGARLGYARLAHDVGPTVGLVGVVGLVLMAFLTSIGYSQGVRNSGTDVPPRAHLTVSRGIPDADAAAQIRSDKNILAILEEYGLPALDFSKINDESDMPWPHAVFAGTCADLRVAVNDPELACAVGSAFAVGRRPKIPRPDKISVPLAYGKTLSTTLAAEPVDPFPFGDLEIYSGHLLVAVSSVDLRAARHEPKMLNYLIDGTGDPWRVYARIHAATGDTTGADFVYSGRTEKINQLSGIIVFSFAASLILLFFVVLVTTLDRSAERRRSDTALLALGVPVTTIRHAHRAEVAHSIAIGLALAVFCGIVSGVTWHLASGQPGGPDIASYTKLAGLAFALWIVALLTSRWVATRRIDVAVIRRD